MYAIVKTGGKQYKVAPGDIIEIEKIEAEEGSKVELEAICIVNGDAVEADPAKAAATKVEAVVLEQFKGEKQLVFKFKKRKNYKRTKGHRQQLTRIRIEAIGSEVAPKMAAKPAAKKDEEAPKAAPAPEKDEAQQVDEAVVVEETAVEEATAEATEEATEAPEAEEAAAEAEEAAPEAEEAATEAEEAAEDKAEEAKED